MPVKLKTNQNGRQNKKFGLKYEGNSKKSNQRVSRGANLQIKTLWDVMRPSFVDRGKFMLVYV
jgi:hypothetical protein